jgi:hypothetical protein
MNAAAAGGYEPPDVQVAAGPGFVVQMVNLAARFWRTTPGAPSQEAQTIPLGTFFGAGQSDRLTDPRVLFDSPSGRWFASISNIDASSVMLAVSRTTDPTGAWSTYSFTAPGCADQPRLGVSDALAVLAADIFATCDSNFSPLLGVELWAVNKQQLLDGVVGAASWTTGPTRSYASLAPGQSLSSAATEYVVSVDNPESRVVHLLAVDGVPPGAIQLREVATPAISPLAPPPAAEQPPVGSGRRQPRIETNDDRILDSVWENGKLWFSANSACTPPGDTQTHACARVIELATATGTVDWDTDLSAKGADLFYPAVSPDGAGNLVIVYGESSTTILPQLVALGRTPDGAFTAPIVVARSAGAVTSERYGDYFGVARDALHPELVWIAGEQGVDVTGHRGWATTVASVQFSDVPSRRPRPLRRRRGCARSRRSGVPTPPSA